jgi:AcrR family transcriptional regulator
VQEVVDRARQSLRSFYQHFDGKHELLVALFEDALLRATDQIRAAATGQKDPLDALKVTIELLFELSRPDPAAQRPLFTDFALQLLTSPGRGEGGPRPAAGPAPTSLTCGRDSRVKAREMRLQFAQPCSPAGCHL